jgi:hypothetical protein
LSCPQSCPDKPYHGDPGRMISCSAVVPRGDCGRTGASTSAYTRWDYRVPFCSIVGSLRANVSAVERRPSRREEVIRAPDTTSPRNSRYIYLVRDLTIGSRFCPENCQENAWSLGGRGVAVVVHSVWAGRKDNRGAGHRRLSDECKAWRNTVSIQSSNRSKRDKCCCRAEGSYGPSGPRGMGGGRDIINIEWGREEGAKQATTAKGEGNARTHLHQSLLKSKVLRYCRGRGRGGAWAFVCVRVLQITQQLWPLRVDERREGADREKSSVKSNDSCKTRRPVDP